MRVQELMVLSIAGLVVVATSSATFGQQSCPDFVCSTGVCDEDDFCAPGDPINEGGSCNDGNDCTTNDSCANGTCQGTPAENGFPCNSGCGTCIGFNVPPAPPITICVSNPEMAGQPCEGSLGLCFDNYRCNGLTGLCLGTVRTCPDADGNFCTADFCNPETGQCQSASSPPCIEPCERCDREQSRCVPTNLGAACDDSNPCSEQSRCEDIGFGRALCVAGAPTFVPPSATPTPIAPTATVPPGATDTPTVPPGSTDTPTVPPGSTSTPTRQPSGCVGDCNMNGVVAVNELVIGVNIVLETASVTACTSFDVNDSGTVQINELVQGVNSLLEDCL